MKSVTESVTPLRSASRRRSESSSAGAASVADSSQSTVVLGARRDLDPTRLELAPQKRELVVIEIELARPYLQFTCIDQAVAIDVLDEAREFLRVKDRVYVVLLFFRPQGRGVAAARIVRSECLV